MVKKGDKHLFQFKQFRVDQRDCAMKINTDGVLLGAMSGEALLHSEALNILDVGTGTGVIALMLAQRFSLAHVTGVEMDAAAAERAFLNFEGSPFSNRMRLWQQDILKCDFEERFDLIVSNPPYFLDALKNVDKRKEMARHAGIDFFKSLLEKVSLWLKPNGSFELILPKEAFEHVNELAMAYGLTLIKVWQLFSFSEDVEPIRYLVRFQRESKDIAKPINEKFVIYASRGQYTDGYKRVLKDFFLDF